MKERKYSVYMHTNKSNNKKYVGMTSLKPERRWGNGSGYDGQESFRKDIQEYGWDGFIHEVLYTDLSKDEAHEKEVELIVKHKTYIPELGYNKNLGNYDVTIKAKPAQGHKRPVRCVETGQVYSSGLAAAAATSLNNSHISACCKGIRRTCGGYHWEFETDYSDAVVCEELNRVFETPYDAAKELNLRAALIKQVIDGKLQTTGKMHWRKASAEEIQAMAAAI